MANDKQRITVTLTKSLSGRLKNHIACARGLGLRKIRQSVSVLNTPENRGMINTISYLLHVQEGEE